MNDLNRIPGLIAGILFNKGQSFHEQVQRACFINYNGNRLTVNSSVLDMVLHD